MGMAAKQDEPTPTQRMARNRLSQLPPRKPFDRQAKLKQAAQREEARVASILAKDQPPAPPKKGKKGAKQAPAIDPTPEWLRRYENACRKENPTTASGYAMAERPIYRKHPWFESLCGRDDSFTDEDLYALRYYRNTYEAAQRSETKCSLASMVHGSGTPSEDGSFRLLRLRDRLAEIERALKGALHTVRAIAIEDLTYEQVAMGRYGYRYAEYFDAASGKLEYRPRPKSGRHPTNIKIEFIAGVRVLTAAVLGISNAPANANGSAPADTPPTGMSITESLQDAIAKRGAAGRVVHSIILAQSVMDAICRENDVDPADLESFQTVAFRGTPVTIREDWPWGWVLQDGEME
jgi:hypothetical protein